MATQIKTWQIVDGSLKLVETSLAEQGRSEPQDLEAWIASEPAILGPDILLIGRQVKTQSGPMDLLGIDRSGNAVVVELKRGRLPREVLAQAIDYASDIASWSIDRLSQVCVEFTGKSLTDVISDGFADVDLENLSINESQRILLVGFGMDSALERMVEWLASSYDVSVNAIVLHYVRTSGGDELLTKTSVVSEAEEQQRTKRRKFKIEMSDEPGQYDEGTLRALFSKYLSSGLYSAERIKNVLLPACLETGRVSRGALVEAILKGGETDDSSTAGRFVSLISNQLGMAKNDYLRQVIGYDYPEYHWQKDNYHIREQYHPLVDSVLEDLSRGAGDGAA